MKSKIILLLAVIIALPVISGCGRRYTKSEKVEHTISASGKERLYVENMSGNIKIVRGTDSSSIIVKATKEVKVRKRDLDKPFDEVRIEIDSVTNEIRIVTNYADYEPGIFQKHRNPVVNYEIHIPENMDVKVENIHGIVSTSDISGDIEISNVSGDIDLHNVQGKVLLDATNGDITGTILSTTGIEINGINTDVRLTIPEDLQARIKADVVNGRISHEQLKLEGDVEEKKSLRGTIGKANIEITIDVVNGRIRLFGKKQEVI